MEQSPNTFTQPISRLKRLSHAIFDRIQSAPDHMSEHYKPSAQIDVGKTAAQAANVQLVLNGLEIMQINDMTHGWDSEGRYL
jgi:hypothetical protein